MGFTALLECLSDEDYTTLAGHLSQTTPYIGREKHIERLDRIYRRFHEGLHRTFHENSDVTFELIEFSDSAFIVVRDFPAARWIARHFLVSCVRQWVPVRAGIGRGGFARLTFATAVQPNGTLQALAPFFGTAVARAYQTQVGAPGFRVFLHPSVVEGNEKVDFVELPADEGTEERRYELRLFEEDREANVQFLCSQVAGMRQWLVPDSRAVLHYTASDRAYRRML
jgi:hypothetical protein